MGTIPDMVTIAGRKAACRLPLRPLSRAAAVYMWMGVTMSSHSSGSGGALGRIGNLAPYNLDARPLLQAIPSTPPVSTVVVLRNRTRNGLHFTIPIYNRTAAIPSQY
jgi:hypothetical protein